jgi:uncharacterized iron-regulated membrane protein
MTSVSVPTDTPKRWRIPPRFVAAALDSHSAIGLAFSALIYLICFTGTLSVLVDELKLFEQPSLPVVTATAAAEKAHPGALNTAVAAVLAHEPLATAIYAVAPTTSRQRLTLTAYGPDGERAFVADTSGSVIPQHTPFTDFVTDLHMTLTAPAPWGSLIVGIAGAALLALIISGVLAHPRIFRDAFRLRLNGSRRLCEAELHNRLSVWGLPFHIAVTLSGALFGLANLIILTVAGLGYHGDTERVLAPLTGPAIAVDSRPAPLPDLQALARRALSAFPGSHLGYVGVERPGTSGTRITVEVGVSERLPRGEAFYFDARGRGIGRGRFLTGPMGLQVYSGAAQVHFGFFGGLPVRLLYVALGSALTFVTASGFTIWLERQKERGKPRPRLRSAWRAWTRGVPAALAAAALASSVIPVSWTFWSIVLLAQGVALWRGTNASAKTAAA